MISLHSSVFSVWDTTSLLGKWRLSPCMELTNMQFFCASTWSQHWGFARSTFAKPSSMGFEKLRIFNPGVVKPDNLSPTQDRHKPQGR
jgi:hypothetical protein